ncbi:endolytic transglycosylase MltG [Oscillibacter sp.]|uniref:endolytic transglycosylase MltG n=2 Tax=Oscillibacter TaxID=459786 RepID=UPI0021749337|nr:endolytic transglycosylase MltG [Oscillibacter sp.]MCI9648869.1 endolytic transglycosylase MltG [Oscillibacter sp.]
MADFKNGDTASWDAEQVRRGQTDRPQQNKSVRRKRRRRINPLLALILYVLIVVAASATMAGVGWLLASDLCAFNRGTKMDVTVEVSAEDTLDTVADKLQEAELIRYKWFFKLFAKVTKAEDKIGIGTYKLNNDMDYHALISGMRSSSGSMSAEVVDVTIPEGYTVAQTIRLLAEKGVNTEENLLEAAKTAEFSYEFIDNESEDISRLEGYLFPDTYQFYVNHNPKGALERLIRNFEQKMMGEDVQEELESSGRSMKEIVTIASLIEKETDGTDQAMIASVIYNRLNGPGDKRGTYGMLQIDAALLYALPDHEGAITSADLETDSPYNLRKYAGLPPTPIANPGMTAINAALYPTSSDYYYYALGVDHKHHYFTDYNSFLNFVNSDQYGG